MNKGDKMCSVFAPPPHSPGYLELGETPFGHALAGAPSLNIEAPCRFPPGP